MKDGVNDTPLPTVNSTAYIEHAAFLGTINPDTNKIPKHLFQGYLDIYNNYFKAPWMPDRTEANPNERDEDDARHGFRCCHPKNIWTAPLPPDTDLSLQMTTSTKSMTMMDRQAAHATLHTHHRREREGDVVRRSGRTLKHCGTAAWRHERDVPSHRTLPPTSLGNRGPGAGAANLRRERALRPSSRATHDIVASTGVGAAAGNG